MFINDEHHIIGSTYEYNHLPSSRLLGKSRLKTQVQRSFSYLLCPLKFHIRKQTTGEKKKLHKRTNTQKYEQKKVRRQSPKDISKQQLLMKSFTLNLHPKKDVNKSVNIRISEYLIEEKYNRSNPRNKRLRLRQKSYLKTQILKCSDYNYKSVDLQVDKLGTKMPIYDRYAQGKRGNNMSVFYKSKVSDFAIRTQRSKSKKIFQGERRSNLVDEIKPWQDLYDDSQLQ